MSNWLLAEKCRGITRLASAMTLFSRPAITPDLPANSASRPIRATSAGVVYIPFNHAGVVLPATPFKTVSNNTGDSTVTVTVGVSSTCRASPKART